MEWGLFRKLIQHGRARDVVNEIARVKREKLDQELYRERARAYGWKVADQMARDDIIREMEDKQELERIKQENEQAARTPKPTPKPMNWIQSKSR